MKKIEIINDIINNEECIIYKFTINKNEENLNKISSFSFSKKEVVILEDEIIVNLDSENFKKIKALFISFLSTKKSKEIIKNNFFKKRKSSKEYVEENNLKINSNTDIVPEISEKEMLEIITKLLKMNYEEELINNYLNLLDTISLNKINSVILLLEKSDKEVEINEKLENIFKTYKIDYKKIYSSKQLKIYNGLNLESLEKRELMLLLNPLLKTEFPIINLLYEEIKFKEIPIDELILINQNNFNYYMGLKNAIENYKNKLKEEGE